MDGAEGGGAGVLRREGTSVTSKRDEQSLSISINLFPNMIDWERADLISQYSNPVEKICSGKRLLPCPPEFVVREKKRNTGLGKLKTEKN